MFKRREKRDREFEEIAMDAARRRDMIAHLTQSRTMALSLAAFITLFSLAALWFPDYFTRYSGLCFGCAALMWILAFKHEADLRLLRVIDRLQEKDGKSTN